MCFCHIYDIIFQSIILVIEVKTLCFVSASELQAWLLYYSIPSLVGYLPDKYLRHFAHLSEGIYILLGDEITESALSRARALLNKFYQDFQDLYGNIIYNCICIIIISSSGIIACMHLHVAC